MVESKTRCSGCNACINICPKKSIYLKKDSRGFNIPVIDKKLCVNCGLCEKVCQCEVEGNLYSINDKLEKVFLAYYPRDEVRFVSQSGGLFYGLAETIIHSYQGVVYGAAVTENLNVAQIRVTDICNLYKLQGSKYVQSDTGFTFKLVEEDLKKDKFVLYSGTSCMIDGLLRFLKAKGVACDRLYTCDFICHGVVSPEIYLNNIIRIQNQTGLKVVGVNFRNKRYGWHSHIETYKLSDGTELSEKNYSELFYSHVALRNSCYECKYSLISQKVSDITMGDFWGIEKLIDNFDDDNKGFSISIVHSDKGKELLEKTSLKLQCIKSDNYMEQNRKEKVKKPYIYSQFWKDYEQRGFEYCLKRYTSYGGIVTKAYRKVLRTLGLWS